MLKTLSPSCRSVAAFCLLGLCLFTIPPTQAAQAAPPPLGVQGVREQRMREPVFGGELMVYRAGRKGAPPVVLVHGLGQNGAKDWAKLIPALKPDYDILALDLPGFGQSNSRNQLYTPENYAAVIEAVVKAHFTEPVTLIGHSMGAAVSLQYAADRPERLQRLILVDMAGILHATVYAESLMQMGVEQATGVDPDGVPVFDSILRGVLTRIDGLPVPRQLLLQMPSLRGRIFRGDPNMIAAYALAEHDFGPALRAVRTPTLLIWGREDKVAPLRTGQLAASLIPGARLMVLDGIGHSPQLQDPARFNAMVLDELKGRSLGAPYAAVAPMDEGAVQDAVCEQQPNARYTGRYRTLTLTGCADALIEQAWVEQLVLTDSPARLRDVQVSGGIVAVRSPLVITAGSVAGAPPLRLDTSHVDAAGTRFENPSGPVVINQGTTSGVTLRLSVAEQQRAGRPRAGVHDAIRLAPGSQW